MSVAMMLGVDDVDAPPMMEARSRWDLWKVREVALSVVDDLLDLPEWTRTADREAKDAALRSLAKFGAADGGDDPAAVTALTWTLVPGGATIAYRLGDLADNIDELVASHLWSAAKTFAWDRRRATAACILRDTRRGVLAELGVGEWARREDRTWAATVCVGPASPAWQHFAGEPPCDDSLSELLDLLEDAASVGVISGADIELLIELAVVADDVAAPPNRGRAGLMVVAASEEVAHRWGMSARSVRRRAASSIDRLALFASVSPEYRGVDVATHGDLPALGA